MVRQSQSEISEIFAGRSVTSVHLLERIADGLGCPRTWWRLTSADECEEIDRLSTLLAQVEPPLAAREAERDRFVAAAQLLKESAAALTSQAIALLSMLTNSRREGEESA